MISQCLYTLDYPGQQFATNVQKWRRWLDSDEAKTLSTNDYSGGNNWYSIYLISLQMFLHNFQVFLEQLYHFLLEMNIFDCVQPFLDKMLLNILLLAT